jgi:hypothetical protein
VGRRDIPDGVDGDQLPCTIPPGAVHLLIHGFTPFVHQRSASPRHRTEVHQRQRRYGKWRGQAVGSYFMQAYTSNAVSMLVMADALAAFVQA